MMKKILKLVCVGILLSFTLQSFVLGNFVYANSLSLMSEEEQKDLEQELLSRLSDGDLSLGRCIYKGNVDFMAFLQTLIYSDGFVEGVLEPFRDIFSRNQCQSTDVLALIKQRDKIRDQIRNSFLDCKPERIPALKKAYKRLNAEIYYVRHIVEGIISISIPFAMLDTIQLQSEDSLYAKDETLYQEMKERYVDEDFSEIEFDVFYKNTRSKYAERKKQYVNCSSGSYKELIAKFQEFIEDWGGTKTALEQSKNRIVGRAEKIYEAIVDPGLADWFYGILTVSINGVPPAMAVEDFLNYISDFGTLPNNDSRNMYLILGMSGEEESKYLREVKKMEIASSFEFLYLHNSDQGAQAFIEELRNLNETIDDSTLDIDLLSDCARAITFRQCTNKQ
jgi:hypothetical protein